MTTFARDSSRIRLLVSVRSADEALLALRGGADLIDVKEPVAGSLGAASPEVWQEIAAAIGRERPLSVALGELTACATSDFSPLENYTFAKLGLAGCAGMAHWPVRWHEVLAQLPAHVQPVAAAYADFSAARSPPPLEIVAVGKRLGCSALLLDTYDKCAGDVFTHLTIAALHELFASARNAGMMTVLAGSLRLERLPQARMLRPDFVAVRGAVCRSTRTGAIDESRVGQWAEQLHLPSSIRPSCSA